MDFEVGRSTTTPHDPVLPPIEDLTDTAGAFNLVARYIKSCTNHQTAADLGDRAIVWKNKGDASKWNRLVKGLATNVTKDLVLPKSSQLEGCGGSIQRCLQDLVEHVLFTIVSEGTSEGDLVGRSDEELMHLLVGNLLKRTTAEFSTGGKTTEEHFKEIAEGILLSAFPGRWEDPHLPDAVRSWGFKKAVGEPEVLWQTAISALATMGVQIHESLHQMDGVDPDLLETEHPGIKKLVEGIVSTTHSKMKGPDLYGKVHLPYLDNASSAFVLDCFAQILSPEELGSGSGREALAGFNQWADDRLAHSLYAVFGTLLKAHPGQTAEERRIEVFDLLFSRMSMYQPALQARRELIAQQDLEGVKGLLREAERALDLHAVPGKRHLFYETQIRDFLSNDASTAEQGKALLRKIASYGFSQSVFEYSRHSGARGETISTFLGVDKREFEAFFTDFFTFESALDYIHSSVGDYFLEFEEQSAVVEMQAHTARAFLLRADRGDELLTGVEALIGKYRDDTEVLAKKRLLKPTEFELLNEILSQLLEPSVVKGSGCALAKDKAVASVNNVVTICLADTIKRHQVEGSSNNVSVDEGVARLANVVLEKAQRGISSIKARMGAVTAEDYSVAALKAKAESIHVHTSVRELEALSEADRKEKLLSLQLTALSQELFKEVVSQESFDALLPSVLQDAHIMEAAASLIVPYLRGFYDKAVGSDQNPSALKVAPEVRPLLDKVQGGLKGYLEVDATSTESAADRTLLSDILHKINQQKSVHAFAESALDQITEAVLAHHLNPADGMTSEQRAAELFWRSRLHFEGCRQHIAELQASEDQVAYFESVSEPGLITEYRRVHKLGAGDALDKVDYLKWQEAHALFEILVPSEILDTLGTPELIPTIRDQLTLVIRQQIETYYKYSVVMDKTIASGQATMEADSDAAFKGAGTVVRGKVQDLLGGIRDGTIETADPWVNGVLVNIAGTDDQQRLQMLERLGFETIYGLLAQAVTGKEYTDDQTSLLLSTLDNDVIMQLDAAFSSGEEVDYSAFVLQTLDGFYPDDTWRQLMHPVLRPILSKATAADMLAVYVKAAHRTHRGLAKHAEGVKDLLAAKPELGITDAYIDANLVAPVMKAVEAVATSSKPLSPGLEPVLDRMGKQVLGANPDSLANIGETRDKLVKQAVYTAFHNILSQEPSPSQYVIDRLVELKATYEGNYESREFQECAHRLLDVVIPDHTWDDLFTDGSVELLRKETVIPVIAGYMVEVAESQVFIKARAKAAREWFDEVDDAGGIQSMLSLAVDSINATVEAYGQAEGDLAEGQPAVVNDVLKGVLASDELSPAIKATTEDLVYILVHRALLPKPPNSTVQQEFVSVCDRLRQGYDDPSMGEEWLKELLPEDLRVRLVPEFLQATLTHETLNELVLKPWFKQVQATVGGCRERNAKDVAGAEGIHAYLKAYLATYGGPESPKAGLTGYGGVVRQMEQGILSQVRSPKTETEQSIDQYLQATSAQLATRLGESGRLEKTFLSNAMLAALPAFQDGTPTSTYTGTADAFNGAAADKVLEDLFPEGKAELLVPDSAKDAVWNKAKQSISDTFADLTERDRRVVYTLKQLDANMGLSQPELDERSEFYGRLLATSKRDEGAFLKRSKALVQKSLWAKTKSQLTGWKRLFKPLAWVVFHVSIKGNFWNTISSRETDGRMRHFLWSAITYKQTPDAPAVGEVQDAFSSAFSSTGLVPWGFRGLAAKPTAAMIYDRNLVDLITPER